MKALVEKLASGVSTYETPDAEVSENRIMVTLECGNTAEGEISVKSKNGLPIKGVATTTNSHVVFPAPSFNGVDNQVKYKIVSDNLYPGQIISGTISLVTDAGDFAIPFGITMSKKGIDTMIGEIKDYDGFVKLVRESYDEALIVFLSKDFKEYFLKDDARGYTLYNQVMKNGNRDIAMEEFLVGMGLKERVAVSTKESYKEFADIKENYSDTIVIRKNTWGYTEVDVEVEGDFFYNCKDRIDGDEFTGNSVEYTYYINAAKLHGGSNHGRITFKTINETIVYDIIIVNDCIKDNKYIDSKKAQISFVKNYLKFRTGEIDGNQWKKQMSITAEDRLSYDDEDMMGLLARAQVAILDSDESLALETLNSISGILDKQKDNRDINEYCYYLYLKTLYKSDANYSENIKKEVKNYFENGFDTWQVLWMLFYMDDRYENNPSLKYTMAKRSFNHGNASPIIYYEAARVFLENPTLLKEIGPFELQVLNFISKYHMINDELAKSVALAIAREKNVSDRLFDIIAHFYDETKSVQLLETICNIIVKEDRRDKKYYKWLVDGVKHELNITNLYEYYIYTIDKSDYTRLEENAYQYFGYGTETLKEGRDYYFANVIHNFSKVDKVYAKSRDDMIRFATDEITKEHNNIHLRHIYKELLNDNFIVGDLENYMPSVLHTYMVKVSNPNIKSIIVAHKEVEASTKTDFKDGVAYVNLYTKNPVIIYEDYKGRFLSQLDSEIVDMSEGINVTKTGFNAMIKLMDTEDLMENAAIRKGESSAILEAMEIKGISDFYKQLLMEFAIDYFHKGYDMGEMDVYPAKFPMEQLSTISHNRIIEILLSRNHLRKAYPFVAKYGYEGVDKKLIEKLCIDLVKDPDFDHNDIVVEMCGEIFRNGCRNEEVLKYLSKHYESGSIELYNLFLSIKSLGIMDNTIAERLIVQYMFENDTSDKLYDIYTEYLKLPTSSKVRNAFYTYTCYNYFIKKVHCQPVVWEVLEKEYSNGFNTPIICKIAFLEVTAKYSQKHELSAEQIAIIKRLVEELAKNGIHFEFYKKFVKWIDLPFSMVDKTVIDFRTNPKHKVEIRYTITNAEGKLEQKVEEMGSIYQGIYSKEIIMFYNEQIDYSIVEYSDEIPEGKVVDNLSIRISQKNIYNDETRFGMINSMMVCQDLGKKNEMREIMQTYELGKIAGKELFKLL